MIDGFFNFTTGGIKEVAEKLDEKFGANGWIVFEVAQIVNLINLIRFTIEDAIGKVGTMFEAFCSAVSHVIHGDFEGALNDMKILVYTASVDTSDNIREMARSATDELFGFSTRVATAGNASADMAETITANMQAIRDQIAATASTSIQGENTGNGIFFKAQIGQAWTKIARAFGYSVGKFADGGFPATGDLFFANESGPELVGTMGSHTAVANNDQIIEGIRQGVYEAVSAAMSNNGGNNTQFKLYLDSKEIKYGLERVNRAWGVG